MISSETNKIENEYINKKKTRPLRCIVNESENKSSETVTLSRSATKIKQGLFWDSGPRPIPHASFEGIHSVVFVQHS